MHLIFTVVFVFVVLPVITIAEIYSFEAKSELNNIVINGNDVYIGAVNYIHRLNSNLAEIKSVKTGPVNDSRSCTSTYNCKNLAPTNNRNTLLLVYKEKAQLITCGSVSQGVCQVRNLSTLDIKLNGSRYVAANDDNSSTVGFISKSRLHVAVTLKDRPEVLSLYAVSTRVLIDNFDDLRRAQIGFLYKYAECILEVNQKYVIHYVSGFQLNEFAYFTSVQPKNELSKSYHSKIIRYCLDGNDFNSYTEIPFSCKDASGIEYNILVAGMLLNATGKTASILNVSNGESVYIGVFSKSVPNSKAQTKDNAICVFPMSNVVRAFNINIRQCVIHGVPKDGGLPWLKDYTKGAQKCPVSIFPP